MNFNKLPFLLIFLCVWISPFAYSQTNYELIIVGGGASGTAAGISAGRLGVKTLIIEQTPWLGGMLTSAGVSAIDEIISCLQGMGRVQIEIRELLCRPRKACYWMGK